jgi:hypothetical protein
LLSKMRELACSLLHRFSPLSARADRAKTEGSTYGFPLPDDSGEGQQGVRLAPLVGAGGGGGD